MDFDLTDDQKLLTDSVARLLSDRYSFEARRGFQKQDAGWSADIWGQFAEMGLLGLPFDEAYGGFGGGAVDVMLVMEQFGKALVLEPYLATVVLAGTALRIAGSDTQKSAILPEIVGGSMKLAFAHGEQGARYDLSDVTTRAGKIAGGWVLDGAKSVVLHGDCADKLVVSARTAGARGDEAGITLFLVDGNAKGVTRRGYQLRDGTRAAEISLASVEISDDGLLGTVGGGFAVIGRVVEAGISAMSAEVVGSMDKMLDVTLDYLRTRHQFGKAIGENQALQHKAADMLISTEQGRSMSMLAAMMVDEADDSERARNIALAKVGVGQAGRFVSQNAVQLHGGIGMTEEYLIGHYFRRVMMFEHSFGDTAHYLNKLADQVH